MFYLGYHYLCLVILLFCMMSPDRSVSCVVIKELKYDCYVICLLFVVLVLEKKTFILYIYK